jgi:hypothetical protein
MFTSESWALVVENNPGALRGKRISYSIRSNGRVIARLTGPISEVTSDLQEGVLLGNAALLISCQELYNSLVALWNASENGSDLRSFADHFAANYQKFCNILDKCTAKVSYDLPRSGPIRAFLAALGLFKPVTVSLRVTSEVRGTPLAQRDRSTLVTTFPFSVTPWKADLASASEFRVWDKYGRSIAAVNFQATSAAGISKEEARRNAELIVTSPEMYTALARFVETYNAFRSGALESHNLLNELIRALPSWVDRGKSEGASSSPKCGIKHSRVSFNGNFMSYAEWEESMTTEDLISCLSDGALEINRAEQAISVLGHRAQANKLLLPVIVPQLLSIAKKWPGLVPQTVRSIQSAIIFANREVARDFPELVPFLVDQLNRLRGKDETASYFIADTLKDLGGYAAQPEVISALIDSLKDKGIAAQSAAKAIAAMAASAAKDPRTLPALLEGSRDYTIPSAAHALGAVARHSESKEAPMARLKSLAERPDLFGEYGLELLYGLSEVIDLPEADSVAIPNALIHMLRSNYPYMRDRAAETLDKYIEFHGGERLFDVVELNPQAKAVLADALGDGFCRGAAKAAANVLKRLGPVVVKDRRLIERIERYYKKEKEGADYHGKYGGFNSGLLGSHLYLELLLAIDPQAYQTTQEGQETGNVEKPNDRGTICGPTIP